MRRKKKKTALKAVFLYLLLSGGSWMFINAYANSFNQISEKRIVPAGLVLKEERAFVELLGHNGNFSLSWIYPESRGYCGAYLLSPDELRAAAYIISLCI